MSEQQLCAIILEIMQIDPALHFFVVSFCCNFAPEKTEQFTRMDITISSIEQIASSAEEFVSAMGNRKIFAFYGKMGVGKTTFIKAVCETLGVTDVINSPTFAIVNEYLDGNDQPIYHFDFYRIKKEEEVYDIGFEDYVSSGNLCLMEWPELIEDLLPEETVRVHIEERDDSSRVVTMDGEADEEPDMISEMVSDIVPDITPDII
jgi:tRNA threonylcarbamoyladenosine biosynthesis protein TsaE